MKKILFIVLFIIGLQQHGFSQWDANTANKVRKELENNNVDTIAWMHGIVGNIGFNEGVLHNWSAGGELASLLVNSTCTGFLSKYYHNNIWTNSISLGYSLNYAYSNDFVPRKTDDRIDFTSKFSHRVDSGSNFYFASVFNFKSQFSKGYDYSVSDWDTFSTSRFMSPGYFILSLGMEFRKGSNFSIYLSPVAGRLIAADKYYTGRTPTGAFGIDSGKSVKYELGAYFSGIYRVDITKNMCFRTRLDLYSNYLARDKKNEQGEVISHDNPGNINVYSENMFTMRFNKYLALSLGGTFIYDNNIPYVNTHVDEQEKKEPAHWMGWWQMKQLFTFGIEYKF